MRELEQEWKEVLEAAGHKPYLMTDGQLDTGAYENAYHNGPQCTVCYKCWCMWCINLPENADLIEPCSGEV